MTEEVSKAVFVVIAAVVCLVLECLIWRKFAGTLREDDDALFPISFGYGVVSLFGAMALLVLFVDLTSKSGPLLLREALR